jgi:hypothetical protein
MKRKKLSKKFSLNKRTVANLDRKSLSGIFGGVYTDPGSTCKFCETEDPFCQPTAACTGSPCPTYDPNCNETIQATCQGFTCAIPNTCNC